MQEPSQEAKDKPTTPIPPSHPGPAGDQSRMPSRQNIKDATKQPPERVAPSGLSLQAKLDARREKEYGGPLQPPGLTTVHADASAREGAPDAGVTTEPSFIEDGDDELHNGVSPGFGNRAMQCRTGWAQSPGAPATGGFAFDFGNLE